MYAVIAVVVVLAALIIRFRNLGMRPKNYPPGPPTIPVFGNLFQMPRSKLHEGLAKMSEQYGPIMGLKLGAMDMIVINSYTTVKDLYDKRSSIYSNRVDNYLRNFGYNLMISNRDNDDVWRRQRKMYHTALTSTAATRYLPYQASRDSHVRKRFESIQLLWDLLNAPYDSFDALKRYTTSTGSTITYGWRVNRADNHYVTRLFEWIESYTLVGIATQVTEFFPMLRPIVKYTPNSLNKLNKELSRLTIMERDLWLDLLREAKSKVDRGKLNPCFAGDMLTNQDKDGLNEMEMAFNAGHAWAGASDTTFNTLHGFVKAMILYPEVQQQAHLELDRVVGADRMPEWEDRNQLPYVRAIVKESLRWCPTAVLGIPHAAAKDDEYMGYKIPKGASVVQNIWGINNDPVRYPNPRKFDPLRYIDDRMLSQESAAQADPALRDHFTFGSGRRICPGMQVADRSLFMVIARMLWAFDIERVGDEVIENDAMTTGLVAGPMPYKSKCVPRDEKRAKLIADSWKEAEGWLDEERNYSQAWYEKEFWKK
ncbi:cytochrome P450 [Fonsecaea pedrosoi]|nr:cytochrome P450 [Fonsecaea pedrosoi]